MAYVPFGLNPAKSDSLRLTLNEVASRGDRRRFARFPWRIYRGDRRWVPPSRSESMAALDPARNPVLAGAHLGLFEVQASNRGLGDEPVGTVAVWIDPEYNAAQGAEVAWFGALEAINEPDVVGELLEAAEGWAAQRLGGSAVLRGPVSLDARSAPGLLVDGFDRDSAAHLPYNPPYLHEMVEAAGCMPAVEWQTYELALTDPDGQGSAEMEAGLSLRPLEAEDQIAELVCAEALYEAAWGDADPAWGARFHPVRPDDGPPWRLIPELTFLAEVDGQPAGAIAALLDLRAVLRFANGRWIPFGWLAYRLVRRRIRRLCVLPPAVLPEWREQGIEARLLYAVAHVGARLGYRRALVGPLPDAADAVDALRALGAEKAQTFRLYEKALGREGW